MHAPYRLQVLGGKLEDATRFYFNLYDIDNDGTVSREEVMNLFMSSKVGAENARENATDLLRVRSGDRGGLLCLVLARVRATAHSQACS